MKPRQLKSGAWNVRIMVEGQSYSFTHADKKTALRMAAEFADEHRRRIENPTLSEALRIISATTKKGSLRRLYEAMRACSG